MPWIDPGATATDAEDGNLPVTVGGDIVDTATVGTYNVTYSATDSGGLTTTETRQVDVIAANTAPVITLLGNNPDTVAIGGNVPTHNAWRLLVENTDQPAVGLHLSRINNTQAVYHIDNLTGTAFANAYHNAGYAPEEAFTGASWYTGVTGSGFIGRYGTNGILPSAIWIVVSGGISVSDIPNTVQLQVSNDYDNSTGIGTWVNIGDVQTITGVAPGIGFELTMPSVYQDPGATATDPEDGDITANILVTGTVDLSTIGQYTLTYDVSDSQGLPAPTVTRIVDVVAAPTPTLTITEATGSLASMLNQTYADDTAVIAAMTALLPTPNTGSMFVQAPSYNGGISTIIGATIPHNLSLAVTYEATVGPPPTSGPLGQLTVSDV